MADSSGTGPSKPSWFWLRWPPRALLSIAAFMPIFYLSFYYLVINLVGPKYWSEWEILISVPIILFIAFIAWVKPIVGGIIAIIVIHLGLFWVILMTIGMQSGIGRFWEPFLFLEYFFLVLGGILSIVYGIMFWLWRRKKHGQT
jgi:hypothetical protein